MATLETDELDVNQAIARDEAGLEIYYPSTYIEDYLFRIRTDLETLNAGSGGGGNVADGTENDTLLTWNDTAGEWQELVELKLTWLGGVATLTVEDAGGVDVTMLTVDADGQIGLRHDGTEVAQTRSAASGGLFVNNQSTGSGFERVLTTSDGIGSSPSFDWITFIKQSADPGGPTDLFVHDGTVLLDGTLQWSDQLVVYGETSIGDPGNEQGSILVNGSTFDGILKVNEFGGTRDASVILHRHANNANVSGDAVFARARGNTASHSPVQDNDILGRLLWVAWGGSSYHPAAEIFARVDGTPGTDDMPAELVFRTTADGANTSTQRMRIRADGSFIVGGGGQTFLEGVSGAEVTGYFDGAEAFATETQGLQVYNATGAFGPKIILIDSPGGTERAQFATSGTLTVLDNLNTGGGEFRFRVSDASAGDTTQVVMTSDEVQIAYDGVVAAETSNRGLYVYDPDGTDDPEVRLYQGTPASPTLAAHLQSFSDDLYLDNNITSGQVFFRASDVSATDETYLTYTPGGAVELGFNGSEPFRTRDAGIEIDEGASSNPQIRFFEGGFANLRLLLFYNGATNEVTVRGEEAGSITYIGNRNVANTAYHAILTGDPDAETILHFDDNDALETTTQGITTRAETGQLNVLTMISGGAADDVAINMQSGSTTHGQIYADIGTSTLSLRQLQTGGIVEIRANGNLLAEFEDGVGVGFNGSAAVAPPTYTVTNPTTDRAFDAAAATLAELRNVVGTIIADLQANGLYA